MLYFTRWKALAIVLTALFICLFAVPNFLPEKMVASWPKWAQRHVVLGLDLQGGSHLLLEVDTKAVRKEMLETLRDDMRRVLREARIGYTGLVVRGSSAEVRIRLTLSEPAIVERVRQSVDQSIQIIERRVNELGTVEPLIQREGTDRILVQVPGLQDPTRLKQLLGKTAKLDFRMVDTGNSVEQATQGQVPLDDDVLYSSSQPKTPYLVEKRVLVSGADLTDAQPGFDQRTSEPIVSFRFNTSGARKFAEVTQQNVGKPFAIVLDNEVISAPVIREPITGGSGQISGSFTVQQANDLAILLRAGALPAPLSIIEERTVGAELGADSIKAGRLSAVAGLFLVALFMILRYGLFGVFADVALTLNVVLLLAALTLFGATLTLPGIAGIVLTMGMAVDANVLIYERIREEQRNGRSILAAIDTGFRRAMATIIDANMTHLIASLILFELGSGPVRGFAVTLGVGIITSFFTAVMVTRLIVVGWLNAARPRKLAI